MTAVAGIWRYDGQPGTERDCTNMLAALSIYGPHDSEQADLERISIGRALYRILPEDKFDVQPLIGGGGRFVLVADLRLDNRDELIATLGVAEAATKADSAILLAAWERWGEETPRHLVGDYAFALFDKTAQKLFLVRDHAGQRPLFFHRGKGFFAFATMAKGLHRLPEIPRAPNEERMAEQLALLPESGTDTFFKDVERVLPAHIATVTRDGVAMRRHWEPSYNELRLSGPDEYAEGLLHHFDTAVRAQLRGGERTIGTHLSSGFDSSAVTASAASQLAPHGGKVIAFTSVPREGFDGRTPRLRHGDEGPVAAKTAARYPNIEHVLIRPGDRSPLDGLDRDFFLFERPMLNLCNGVWMSRISDEAKARGLSVMLTGQMGNMSISYDGWTYLPRLFREGHFRTWLRESRGLVRNGHMRVRNVLAQTFGPVMPTVLWRAINRVFRGTTSDISGYSAIHPERYAALNLEERAKERDLDTDYRPRTDGFAARLWVLSRIDTGTQFKGLLAGWGYEMRDPTADRRLFEFSLNIPESQFLRDGRTKALARHAFKDRLPPEVVHQVGKGYQAADWYESIARARGQLGEELERLGDCAPAAAALDLERLRRLTAEWPTDGWGTQKVMQAYRLALLRGISAGHFLRRASGSNA
jgi:asparagine synthase (glutamine-hydrolysing)